MRCAWRRFAFEPQRELRDLPSQIERGSQEARSAVAACGEYNKQIETTRLQGEERQRRLAELARHERAQRQRVEELRRRADRAVQARRWQEERCAQTSAESDFGRACGSLAG